MPSNSPFSSTRRHRRESVVQQQAVASGLDLKGLSPEQRRVKIARATLMEKLDSKPNSYWVRRHRYWRHMKNVFLFMLYLYRKMKPNRLTAGERAWAFRYYTEAGEINDGSTCALILSKMGITAGTEETLKVMRGLNKEWMQEFPKYPQYIQTYLKKERLEERGWQDGELLTFPRFMLVVKWFKKLWAEEKRQPVAKVVFFSLGGNEELELEDDKNHVTADILRDTCDNFQLTVDVDGFIKAVDDSGDGALQYGEFVMFLGKEAALEGGQEDANTTTEFNPMTMLDNPHSIQRLLASEAVDTWNDQDEDDSRSGGVSLEISSNSLQHPTAGGGTTNETNKNNVVGDSEDGDASVMSNSVNAGGGGGNNVVSASSAASPVTSGTNNNKDQQQQGPFAPTFLNNDDYNNNNIEDAGMGFKHSTKSTTSTSSGMSRSGTNISSNNAVRDYFGNSTATNTFSSRDNEENYNNNNGEGGGDDGGASSNTDPNQITPSIMFEGVYHWIGERRDVIGNKMNHTYVDRLIAASGGEDRSVYALHRNKRHHHHQQQSEQQQSQSQQKNDNSPSSSPSRENHNHSERRGSLMNAAAGAASQNDAASMNKSNNTAGGASTNSQQQQNFYDSYRYNGDGDYSPSSGPRETKYYRAWDPKAVRPSSSEQDNYYYSNNNNSLNGSASSSRPVTSSHLKETAFGTAKRFMWDQPLTDLPKATGPAQTARGRPHFRDGAPNVTNVQDHLRRVGANAQNPHHSPREGMSSRLSTPQTARPTSTASGASFVSAASSSNPNYNANNNNNSVSKNNNSNKQQQPRWYETDPFAAPPATAPHAPPGTAQSARSSRRRKNSSTSQQQQYYSAGGNNNNRSNQVKLPQIYQRPKSLLQPDFVF